jgi:hypothetical protein
MAFESTGKSRASALTCADGMPRRSEAHSSRSSTISGWWSEARLDWS